MRTFLRAAPIIVVLAGCILAQQLSTLVAPPAVSGAPTAHYTDITATSGIQSFRHVGGNPNKPYLPETLGSGVALVDINNDGLLDIYLVNSLATPAQEDQSGAPSGALFLNRGEGKFSDVTARAGLENRRWGVGVCAGDIDNDGWTDLFVTNLGRSRLYRNQGDGAFRDIAAEAHVQVDGWATGCAFGDYDHDGLLDLYVARYVKFDWKNPPPAGGEDPSSGAAVERASSAKTPAMGAAYDPGKDACRFLGARVACGPMGLPAASDFLFHNEGNGKFRDVTRESKAGAVSDSYGLAVGWVDVDDDGWIDIVVANDSRPNYLFRNQHDGTFEEAGMLSGLAVNGDGHEQAYMGMAVGDYDGDGRNDFFFTTFSGDNYTLHRSRGGLDFSDASLPAGIASITMPFLGWGTMFVDYDNDGRLDLFAANGHIFPQADPATWGTSYLQRPLLLRNQDGARFVDVSGNQSTEFATPRGSRGAAAGELFNSGAADIVLNNLDQAPTLLRNTSAGHWISILLEGDPAAKTPRDAIGSVVYCVAGGRKQRGEVASGRSYVSQSDLRVRFGLGSTDRVESLEIHWAGGGREVIRDVGVDQFVKVVQGSGRAVAASGKNH